MDGTRRIDVQAIFNAIKAEGKGIKHYGIKGMKWGVRRKDPSASTATDVEVKKVPGKKVQTSGGKNQPVSDDAVKTAISRQKAKSSSTDSLSTKELQELVNRMNLEQQYDRLSTPQKAAGQKFVEDMLKRQGKNLATQGLDAVSKKYGAQIGAAIGKKAFSVGGAAAKAYYGGKNRKRNSGPEPRQY